MEISSDIENARAVFNGEFPTNHARVYFCDKDKQLKVLDISSVENVFVNTFLQGDIGGSIATTLTITGNASVTLTQLRPRTIEQIDEEELLNLME